MKKSSLGLIVVLIAIVFVFGFNLFGKTGNAIAEKNKIVVYKSSSCGCCVGHVAELKKNGFDVEVKLMEDISSIKQKYNIPFNMQSCHTAIIGDYFVEGHMPIKAINKLLEEKPDIDGIALPGMPAGSPGMPGVKSETWIIYSLYNGEVSEFMRI